MLARVGEGFLSRSRGGIPFGFPEGKGMGPEFVLSWICSSVRAPRCRRSWRLRRRASAPVATCHRRIRDFRRHPRECGGVAFDADAEIAPKALQGTTDGVG